MSDWEKLSIPMRDALHAVCLADHNTKHKTASVHWKTGLALSRRGYLEYDGCEYGDMRYLSCYLVERKQDNSA